MADLRLVDYSIFLVLAVAIVLATDALKPKYFYFLSRLTWFFCILSFLQFTIKFIGS